MNILRRKPGIVRFYNSRGKLFAYKCTFAQEATPKVYFMKTKLMWTETHTDTDEILKTGLRDYQKHNIPENG